MLEKMASLFPCLVEMSVVRSFLCGSLSIFPSTKVHLGLDYLLNDFYYKKTSGTTPLIDELR